MMPMQGSNPGPLNSEFDTLPLDHHVPSLLCGYTCIFILHHNVVIIFFGV